MSDVKFADFYEFKTLKECEKWVKTNSKPIPKHKFHPATDGVMRMDPNWHIICWWNYGPRGCNYYKYFCCRTLCEGKQEWHIFCTATVEDTERASQQLEQWINEGMYNVTLQEDDEDFVV